MEIPTPPANLQMALEGGASEDLYRAHQRYIKGVRAIADSLDVPVGLTPKEVVWTLNKAKLYRHVPTWPPEERHRVPLLLV